MGACGKAQRIRKARRSRKRHVQRNHLAERQANGKEPPLPQRMPAARHTARRTARNPMFKTVNSAR